MATTIVPSNLTVTISESYTLNGVDYGNTMNKTYIDNGQVSQRVMSISPKTVGEETNHFTTILSLNTLDAKGQVVRADYKYFRITNLDDTNTLNLRFFNNADYVAVKVLPSSSFLLMDNGIDVPASDTAVLAIADISEIVGQSSSSTESLDIEFVMVTS
jgi:hypothetical protein|tara:strand:- start:59 stop:535 length:477 start_codon:yes stop_codon:yes gene_type:complete